MASQDLLERHRGVLGPHTPLFYDRPLHLVRGEGVWLEDDGGRRYLDAYNNVPCVGHANPRVVAAMSEQAATLNVHSRYLHEGVVAYAERLAGLHADELSSVVFACTGTEANEIAIMTARAATGRAGIITTEGAYHGNSTEVRKLSSLGDRRRAGQPLPDGIGAVPVPDAAPVLAAGGTMADALELHLGHLRRSIEDMARSDHGLAAVLMCSLLANEGLPVLPDGYLAAAVEVTHEAGAVFVADEVQAGFGRSGDWWGYETNGFVPDIAVMGKPIGCGYPVSAVVARAELIEAFRRSTRYFNTFAASAVQAAVGSAVIDEIEDRGVLASVRRVGAHLIDRVSAIEPWPRAAGPVRGVGLFVGIDWCHDDGSPDVAGAAVIVDQMKDRGVLMGRSGEHGNCLKIRPPLVFEQEHADLVADALADVFAAHA